MHFNKKTNFYLLLFVIFGGFLIFGVSENIKGPAIPDMQQELSLSDGTLGALLAINAFGFLLACTYTSWLIAKIGAKTTSILTFALMAISGLFIYFSTNFASLVGAYFLLYIGNGMLEISLAIIAARLFTKHTGTMLNLSHFFYGLGSTVAPIVAAQMMGWEINATVLGWRGMYLIILSLSVLPIIPVVLSRFPKEEGDDEEDRTSIKKLTKDPIAWLIVFALTMGVTAELGIAAWLVNYLVKVSEWTIADASGMLSIFFFSFMLARLLLGPVTDKFGYAISIIVFSFLAGVLSLIPIFTGGSLAILFAIAGFGIGGVITNLIIGYIIEWVTNLSFGTTFAESNKIGMQAGYFFISMTAILCGLATIEIYRRLRQEGNVL